MSHIIKYKQKENKKRKAYTLFLLHTEKSSKNK